MGKMPARNDGGEESALSPTNGSSARPVIHTHRHNLRNRFHIEKTIGEGTYGKVKLAVEKNTGEQVAIKYIKLTKISNEQDLSRIRREIKIMSTLNHPNIISVREVFENREKIILVMDYAAGGELYDYINTRERLTEKEARKIFRQIVAAIYYSHQHGVVHRDLKLENIVLDGQENVKIADFGLSNYHKPGHLLSTFCGSPLYASPEIVNGIAYKGPEVDCWSLGVLLYTLVYGAMPFDGSDFKRLRKQITMGDYYEPAKSSDAAGLIRQLLTVNRDRRASMEAIVHHWWVNLGYKITPNNEPYPSQWLLKAGTGRDHSSFSSDSDGEIDLLEIKKRGAFRSKATWRRKRIERTFEEDEAVYDVDQETKFLNGRENFLGAVDISENKENSKTISADMKGASEESRQLDSEGKPIRSILKRRSQYIGGDSGCILNDSVAKEMRDTVDGGYEPVFTSQAGDKLIDSKSKTLTDNTVFQKAAGNEFCTEKPYVNSKRGILKRPSQSSDPRKRLSFGSVGSNSSGDILDFSYDSGDGDQFLMKYSAQLKYEGHPDKIQQVKFCQQDLASLHISQSSHGEARSSFQFFDREEASEVHQCALKICHKLC